MGRYCNMWPAEVLENSSTGYTERQMEKGEPMNYLYSKQSDHSNPFT